MSVDYSAYAQKKVKVTLANGTQVEGRVEAGSEVGLVLRAGNRQSTELIEASSIGSVEEITPTAGLKRSTLAPVTLTRVKQHLADRHGFDVKEVEELSDADALAYHEAINHAPLSHRHRVPLPVETVVEEAGDEG